MKLHHLPSLLLLLLLIASPVLADFDAAVEIYRQNNYQGAMKAFLPLAEQGDARAQTVLGIMYEYGEGTPQDLGISFIWYERAAELGYAPAQYHTGVMLANGIGVDADRERSVAWLTRSAEAGYSRANDKLVELNAAALKADTRVDQHLSWSRNWDFSLPNDILFQVENSSGHRSGIEPPDLRPHFLVQLGAMSSKKSAVSMWDSLVEIDQDHFEGFSLIIEESARTNSTLYKVQTGPFGSIEQARTFCSNLAGRIVSDCFALQPAPENTSSLILPWDPALESRFTNLIHTDT